ncbi:hypothetical protein [Sporolactobacillus terrae]|uniref:hypothetical protein n=1 Tax=Sporolactobacillus terrae TaxID=269673 RepID=UPI00048A9CB4|nr:hypothetical protein [Sporolactobacillus terrae]
MIKDNIKTSFYGKKLPQRTDLEVLADAKKTFLLLGKEIRQYLDNGVNEDTSGLLNEYVNLYDALKGR